MVSIFLQDEASYETKRGRLQYISHTIEDALGRSSKLTEMMDEIDDRYLFTLLSKPHTILTASTRLVCTNWQGLIQYS